MAFSGKIFSIFFFSAIFKKIVFQTILGRSKNLLPSHVLESFFDKTKIVEPKVNMFSKLYLNRISF